MAIVLAGLVASGSVSAQDQGGAHTCVPRDKNDTDGAWQDHTRHWCEVRWDGLVSQNATGRWTHPRYIDYCLRRCRVGYLESDTAPGGFSGVSPGVFAAAAGVGLAVAAATIMGGHNESPASP